MWDVNIRKREGVIIMKNLLKNKKGFTLAEILLVVAIVVVLSGATMIGIASMVNRSKAAASIAQSKSADFEADAVLEVNKKKGMLPNLPVETETLATGNNEGGNNGNTNGNNTNTNTNTNTNGNGSSNADATTAETTAEETTAAETTKASESQSGGTTDPFSMTSSGSKTIAADPSKKLLKVVIEWENNNQESWGMAHSQFVVTYNDSNGGNYNNRNNTIGGQSNSRTESIELGIEGCTGINITYTSGKFTIKSIKYIYQE